MIKSLKRLLCALISLASIMGVTAINISASQTAYSWYIKRNGIYQPHETAESRLVEQYNGLYIDKLHGDDSTEKKIYLTFDAGYENGNIEQILNTMKEKNVKGAFFILNNLILKNTDLVVRMANEGHLVCNHTNNHKSLCNYSKSEIERDLSALEALYKQKTGLEMTKYFRFPEGKFSENALKYVDELGYKTVFWSFAYDDWDNSRQMSYDKAITKVLSNTHNGAIILLHPTSSTNAHILPKLIDEWRKEGYEFGTLDEIC